MNTKPIVMSGIRPTGYLHLGNFFGAIQNYLRLQNNYHCFFMVADLHSLTTHPDTKQLKENVHRVIAENLACGLDPEKATIYCQSHIKETSELYLYLNNLAYQGELEKTATFKEKARSQPNNINAGLLTYPVLMATDIVLHRATLVPVGKDQEQHLEMARNFVQRFNYRYENIFPEPEAYNFGQTLLKVPSLDGLGKMSKSENINATIYLNDSDELIRSKIKKAKMDGGPKNLNETKTTEVENIFILLKLVSSDEVVNKFENDFENATIKYGELKMQLADDMIKFITPIREKAKNLLADENKLTLIMKEGALKARESASITMQLVRKAMGLNYF